MKKPLLLILFFTYCFIPVFSQAQVQNLVPNPSFEYFTHCPNSGNASVDYDAPPWFSVFSGQITYYSACSTSPPTPPPDGVPYSQFAYQYARTGNAYASIFCTYYEKNIIGGQGPGRDSVGRDYAEVPLIKTLQAGRKYCVQFFLANPHDDHLGDIDYGDNGNAYSSNDMGAYFSDTAMVENPLYYVEPALLYVQPQVVNPPSHVLGDTSKWMPVSGSFIAVGGEKYMTIGNFTDNYSSHITRLFTYPDSLGYSYPTSYFLDDVSVIEMPDSAAGTNTTICNGDSTQIGAVAESNFTYRWFPEVGLRLRDTAISNPYVKPTQTTIYYVTVQDSAGCASTDSVVVTVFCDNTIQIPNVITPNNDGKNDAFFIENLPEESKLIIYNRWGNTVYQSTNYPNNWEAENVSAGTYYYFLTLPSGEMKKGFLEVIK